MIAKMSGMTGKTLKEHKRSFVPENQSLLFRGNYFKELTPGVSMQFSRGAKLIRGLSAFFEETLKETGCEMITVPPVMKKEDGFPGLMALLLENELKSYKDYPAGFYFSQMVERTDYKAGSGIFGGKYFNGLNYWRIFDSPETNEKKHMSIQLAIAKKMDEIGVNALFVKDARDGCKPGEKGIFWAGHDQGDTVVFKCDSCGYAATERIAAKRLQKSEEYGSEMPEPIHTPQVKTIKDLSEFADVPETKISKAIAVSAGGRLIVLMMRGDRVFNPHKLSEILGIDVGEIKMAEEEEIEEKIASKTGFIGPVGLEAEIWVDSEIPVSGMMLVGANKKDYHLKNVLYGRDYKASRVEDLVYAVEGDSCPCCGKAMSFRRGFELGSFANYGESFSKASGITFLNSGGKASSFSCHEGCLDLYSVVGMICQENRDELGICWPEKISPYDFHVLVLNSKKEDQVALGEKVAEELSSVGIDVILDDRPERAGFKFKDCELLGIPKIVVVGKNASEGIVEYRDRRMGSETIMKYEELVKLANH